MSQDLLSPGRFLFRTSTRGKWVLLTDGANIAVDASLSDFFFVTLGGDRQLDNPTNPPAAADLLAARILFRIRQDGTGTRLLTFDTAYRFPGGAAPTLTTTAGKTDYFAFLFNEIDSVWDLVGSAFNL